MRGERLRCASVRGLEGFYHCGPPQRMHFRARPASAGGPDQSGNRLRDPDDRGRRPNGLRGGAANRDGRHFSIAHATLLRIARRGVCHQPGPMESHDLRRRRKSQDIGQSAERSRPPFLSLICSL